MVKTMTLKKQKKFLRNTRKIKPKNTLKLKKNAKVIEYSATERLTDENFIAMAIWECLKNNDSEGVIEVIEAHLEAINKVKASHNMDLPRSTMYNAFKSKNPTVKTLAKLINCCS